MYDKFGTFTTRLSYKLLSFILYNSQKGLRITLLKDKDGKELVDYLDHGGPLTNPQRRLLVRLAVAYLVEKLDGDL